MVGYRKTGRAGPLTWLLFSIVLGCAAPRQVIIEPPAFPEGFMNARWGGMPEDVKGAVEKDGNEVFQDVTHKPRVALYAFGTYLTHPSIFSYYFTPQSKRLYRVDVTFDDPKVYGGVKEKLKGQFKEPTFSHTELDQWSWRDKSLIILQKDSTHVQISYWSGPFLVKQHEEEGLERK